MERTLQLKSERRMPKLETGQSTGKGGGMEIREEMVDRAAERAYELLHKGRRRA
jgi:hypothetical protein